MLDIRKKLEEEMAALEYELRNELPREILKARAHGDLKENAEYHTAKDDQAMMETRQRAELVLGTQFNKQRFHDFVLAQGLLPPDLLQKAVMEDFVPSELKRS